jgi:hypothetical protein
LLNNIFVKKNSIFFHLSKGGAKLNKIRLPVGNMWILFNIILLYFTLLVGKERIVWLHLFKGGKGGNY